MIKKILYFVFVIYNLYASEIFDEIQKNILEENKKDRDIKLKLLKNSWINPLFINLSINNSLNAGQNSVINGEQTSINIEQPIFKSGGLWYLQDKVKILAKVNKIKDKKEKIELLSKIYEQVINLKKIDLNLKKTKYLIKNKKLEIDKKQNLYYNGLLDIIDLDEAIISLSLLKNQIEDLKANKLILKINFKRLSKKKYKNIRLKVLSKRLLKNFIKRNMNIKIARLNRDISKIEKDITSSKFLPEISATGSYGLQNNNSNLNYDKFYQYGLKLKFPLSVNSSNSKKEAKINYLILKNRFQDILKYEKDFYSFNLRNIRLIDNKIKNIKDIIKRYKSIYLVTKKEYKYSFKAKFDVDILENRFKSSKIDIMILRLDKKLIFNKLFKKI